MQQIQKGVSDQLTFLVLLSDPEKRGGGEGDECKFSGSPLLWSLASERSKLPRGFHGEQFQHNELWGSEKSTEQRNNVWIRTIGELVESLARDSLNTFNAFFTIFLPSKCPHPRSFLNEGIQHYSSIPNVVFPVGSISGICLFTF